MSRSTENLFDYLTGETDSQALHLGLEYNPLLKPTLEKNPKDELVVIHWIFFVYLPNVAT